MTDLLRLGCVPQVSFRLSEDLTSLGAAGQKDAPPQVPRDHPFRMHAVGGQTLLVYSHSDAGQRRSVVVGVLRAEMWLLDQCDLRVFLSLDKK